MRTTDKALPAFPDPAGVTDLRVWFCKYTSLAPLASLHGLRTVVVASYPDDDLNALAPLEHLEYLLLLHLPRVSDLAPLGKLSALRTLRLHTLPSWDSSDRVTEVASLAPIATLPNLAHLELFGVRPASQSLADLERSSSLRTVRVSKYPEREVSRYRAASGTSDAFAPRPGVADWS